MLAESKHTVPLAHAPVEAARVPVLAAGAGGKYAGGGAEKIGLDIVAHDGRHQAGEPKEARENALEGSLIVVALHGGLARRLVHDVGVLHEEDLGSAPNVLGTVEPNSVVGVVIHERSSREKQTTVVSPLQRRDNSAGALNGGTVIDGPIVASRLDESNLLRPVPNLDGPVSVGLVMRVSGQTGCDIEQTTICDGVLIVVTVVPCKDLPSQTTAAVVHIPPRRHGIKDGLSKVEPLGLVICWVCKVLFRSSHHCNTPKSLIIITFRSSLVCRHVIPVSANLEQ